MKDALAPVGDEGRGKLRKVTGISKLEKIREYPNGEIRYGQNRIIRI